MCIVKNWEKKIAKIEMSSEVQFSYFHTDDSAPPPVENYGYANGATDDGIVIKEVISV